MSSSYLVLFRTVSYLYYSSIEMAEHVRGYDGLVRERGKDDEASA